MNTRTTKLLLGKPPITTVTEVPGHSPQFAISRLPKLTLPMFSGKSLEWLTYWGSFQARIHSNPNLSGVQVSPGVIPGLLHHLQLILVVMSGRGCLDKSSTRLFTSLIFSVMRPCTSSESMIVSSSSPGF